MAWAFSHAKAIVPERLISGVLWNVDGAHRTKLRPGSRQVLSAAPVLPPTRFVCFEAMLQKTLDYPNDALDIAFIRAKAYQTCGVASESEADPAYVLLETRGTAPTTTRRIANFEPTRELLLAYAHRFSMPLEVRQFSSQLSYCDQVKIAAKARVFFGVHGMAQENAIFMRPGSMLIELFHRSYADDIRSGNVGRQQLFRGSDMYYASAALLESSCTQAGWKFNASCQSLVNISELETFLTDVADEMSGRTSALSGL